MGRKVFITSDMSSDERLIDVAAQDPLAALMWPWILTALDDWGRGEASPKRLKARVFPMNPGVTVDDIERALGLYADTGLLILYEVGGKRYMAVPSERWLRWQTHIRKVRRPGKDKMESDFPAPPSGEDGGAHESPRDPAGDTGAPGDPVPSPSPSPSPTDINAATTTARAREDDAPLPPGESDHEDLPPWLREVNRAYFEATGQHIVYGRDSPYLHQVRQIATLDQILRGIRRGAERKRRRPIRSFAYFVPIIQEIVEDDQARQEVAAGGEPVPGGDPADQERDFSALYIRG